METLNIAIAVAGVFFIFYTLKDIAKAMLSDSEIQPHTK